MNFWPEIVILIHIQLIGMLKEQNLDLAEESNSIASNEMIMNGEGNKTLCSKRQSQKHVVMNWGGNYEGLQLNYFAKFLVNRTSFRR